VVLTSTNLSAQDQAHLHGYVDTIVQKESCDRDELLLLIQKQLATVTLNQETKFLEKT
jgi:hypothetical protein